MKSERCLLALCRGAGLLSIPQPFFNYGEPCKWVFEEKIVSVRAGTTCAARKVDAAYNKFLTSRNEIVTTGYICTGKLGLAPFFEG